MKLKHFPELDGVRAIAALMVMFYHFFVDIDTHGILLDPLKKISSLGQTGVSLFFVLSGFLITRILIATKRNASYFQSFYVRRALRIFPLYYLFLIIYYFLLPALTGESFIPFKLQWPYWTYLENIATTFEWDSSGPSHFWSLAIEEHFYIFWPLVVFCCNTSQLKKAIVIIIMVAFASRILLMHTSHSGLFFTSSRMDELAIGGLLAVWESENKLESIGVRKFAFVFALLLIPSVALWVVFAGTKIHWLQIIRSFILALMFFSLIGLVLNANNSNLIKKALRLGFLKRTGKISYGLYVYHVACFALMKQYFPNAPILALFVLDFGISFLIASLSYHLFESRFLALKDKFSYDTTKKKHVSKIIVPPDDTKNHY